MDLRNEIISLMTERYGACAYNDALHTYTLDGMKLTSVTRLKSTLKAPFERDKIAAICAQKRGTTSARVIAEWDAITQCGTMVHELLEAVLFSGAIQRPTDHSQYSHLAHERYHNYRRLGIPAMMIAKLDSLHLDPVAAEFRVWNAKYGGTLDLLCRHAETGNLHVVDWKCNGRGGMANIDRWTKRLEDPFGHVPDNHLGEYSVQLETYATMLRPLGLIVGEGHIIHGFIEQDGRPKVEHHTTIPLALECAKWIA